MNHALSREWMEKQGWTPGKGLGKQEQGTVRPVALKRVMSFDTFDFNHFSSLYSAALENVGDDRPEKRVTMEERVFAGMFVKATAAPEPVKKSKIDNEEQLLQLCGNRTARRSVKKLKLSDHEVKISEEKKETDEKSAKKEEKDKKKKKKKQKKEEKKQKKKKEKKAKKMKP